MVWIGLNALLTTSTKIELHIGQSSKHVSCFPVQTATTKIEEDGVCVGKVTVQWMIILFYFSF